MLEGRVNGGKLTLSEYLRVYAAGGMNVTFKPDVARDLADSLDLIKADMLKSHAEITAINISAERMLRRAGTRALLAGVLAGSGLALHVGPFIAALLR